MTQEEAKQWLEKNRFIYLGSANILDCWTEFYVRRSGDTLEVALVDGWLNDYRPSIYTTRRTIAELCKRLEVVARYRCASCQHEFNADETGGDFDNAGNWQWKCPHCAMPLTFDKTH